eukprot:4428305-Karenia_brevis.AAC.1
MSKKYIKDIGIQVVDKAKVLGLNYVLNRKKGFDVMKSRIHEVSHRLSRVPNCHINDKDKEYVVSVGCMGPLNMVRV